MNDSTNRPKAAFPSDDQDYDLTFWWRAGVLIVLVLIAVKVWFPAII